MEKLYRYVGPAHLEKYARAESERVRLEEAAGWVGRHPDVEEGELMVTFVLLEDGVWIADRHSEHIACARGAAVYCAGEMRLAVDRRRRKVEVVYVSNQSTGYCPEPESWDVLREALVKAGVGHPEGFSVALVFRRCLKCGGINVVKDGWFVCGVCEGELPGEWNLG